MCAEVSSFKSKVFSSPEQAWTWRHTATRSSSHEQERSRQQHYLLPKFLSYLLLPEAVAD
jgi:hypothetical protein